MSAVEGRVLTDTHAHLGHVSERLGDSMLEVLLASYKDVESAFLVDIGTRPGDLAGRIDRYGHNPAILFSAGLWPGSQSLNDPEKALSALEADIKTGRCAALGECGLDYFHMDAEPARQKSLFRAQAAMAVEAGLPLIVHSREAYPDTLSIIAEVSDMIPVVLHCFGYGPAEAQSFLEAGCFLSFAGNLTYPKSSALREAMCLTPLDRLLFETDSPYMNPLPFRGTSSTSLDIGRTIGRAAELRGMECGELERIFHNTAFKIFRPEI
jgi:TatD DNase family protein